MKDVRKKTGYDLEEAYFDRVNRELIQRLQVKQWTKHKRQVIELRELRACTQNARQSQKKIA